MASYPYQALNLPNETRIIIISPGRHGDDIVCSMSHMPLFRATDVPHAYNALSYCWNKSVLVDKEPDYAARIMFSVFGDGVNESAEVEFNALHDHPYMQPYYVRNGGALPAGMIVCDGVEMKVGGELHAAMKHLRLEDRPLRLWIDALCINQNDVSERNEHVKVMGTIYAGADHVHIWLGERIGIETEALHALEVAAQILTDAMEKVEFTCLTPLNVELRIQKDERLINLAWESLTEFLNRAWFRRIWVVQEVAYARNATIHIGDLTLDWNWLSSVIMAARKFKMDGVFTSLSANSVCIMGFLNRENKENMRIELPLLESLEETRMFQSTLATDKIYGILGLVRETENITVDYSLDSCDLFKRVAVDFLMRTKFLDIIYHCVLPQTPSSLRMPSWVADWTAPGFVEPFRSRGLVAKASGDTEVRLTIDESESVLRVWGKRVDTILTVDDMKSIPAPQSPEEIGLWGAAAVVEDRRDVEASTNRAISPRYRNDARVRHSHANIKASLENILAIAYSEPKPATSTALARTFMCDNMPEGQRPDTLCCRLGLEVLIRNISSEIGVEACIREMIDDRRTNFGMDEFSAEKREEKVRQAVGMFTRSYNRWTYNRRFFKTASGNLGWGVHGIQAGDVVSIFFGGAYPMVLREQESGKHIIIGDCYLDEFMNGEGLVDLCSETLFEIV